MLTQENKKLLAGAENGRASKTLAWRANGGVQNLFGSCQGEKRRHSKEPWHGGGKGAEQEAWRINISGTDFGEVEEDGMSHIRRFGEAYRGLTKTTRNPKTAVRGSAYRSNRKHTACGAGLWMQAQILMPITSHPLLA